MDAIEQGCHCLTRLMNAVFAPVVPVPKKRGFFVRRSMSDDSDMRGSLRTGGNHWRSSTKVSPASVTMAGAVGFTWDPPHTRGPITTGSRACRPCGHRRRVFVQGSSARMLLLLVMMALSIMAISAGSRPARLPYGVNHFH